MDHTASLIILGLAVAWSIQYILTIFQMRRFYKRVAELRRLGTVSIGVAGSTWKRRQYGVLVVDVNHRIVHVEQLSGWTVLASLKPVAGFDGHPMSDLDDETVEWPVSEKLVLALRNAASYIKNAPNRTTAAAPADESQLSNSVTAS